MLLMADKYISNPELLWGDTLRLFTRWVGDNPAAASGSPLHCDLGLELFLL